MLLEIAGFIQARVSSLEVADGTFAFAPWSCRVHSRSGWFARARLRFIGFIQVRMGSLGPG